MYPLWGLTSSALLDELLAAPAAAAGAAGSRVRHSSLGSHQSSNSERYSGMVTKTEEAVE